MVTIYYINYTYNLYQFANKYTIIDQQIRKQLSQAPANSKSKDPAPSKKDSRDLPASNKA